MKNTTQRIIASVLSLGLLGGLYYFNLLEKAAVIGFIAGALFSFGFVIDCAIWCYRHRGQ